ncbi:MAG: hypothetical protein PHY45_09365 [Rhodocyclaceae bacterium]|nr:hypothetical protein [Rhodocyclaceae bacterium]
MRNIEHFGGRVKRRHQPSLAADDAVPPEEDFSFSAISFPMCCNADCGLGQRGNEEAKQ